MLVFYVFFCTFPLVKHLLTFTFYCSMTFKYGEKEEISFWYWNRYQDKQTKCKIQFSAVACLSQTQPDFAPPAWVTKKSWKLSKTLFIQSMWRLILIWGLTSVNLFQVLLRVSQPLVDIRIFTEETQRFSLAMFAKRSSKLTAA